MRYSRYLLILFVLLVLSCSVQNEKQNNTHVEIDDLGRKVLVPDAPERIISLTPSITELLYTFTDTTKLVGRSIWCDYPVAVKKKPAVNNYPVDIEAIVLLKPDLVFVKNGMITLQELDKLEQLHVPVFVQQYDLLNQIEASIRKMVHMTNGDSLKSEQWIHSIIIDTLKQHVGHKRAIAIVSVSPVYVFGKATFVSELLERAGGKNVIDIPNSAYPTVDVEYILRADPELFLFSSKEQQNLFFETYPVLKKCIGYKTNHLFVIDDSVLSRPGVRLPVLKDSLVSILSK